MKSREHLLALKEKLAYAFYKKLNDENSVVIPPIEKEKGNDSSEDNLETGNSYDSTIASQQNNTPKSKLSGIKNKSGDEHAKDDDHIVKNLTTAFQYPHPNVIYKYWIGKGNNSIMVRTLFKNRYWWVQGDISEPGTTNFCWTQVKT